MKSNKQKRKELKEARKAKQAKRTAAMLVDTIFSRKIEKVPICWESLSDESRRSWGIGEYYEDQYYNCVDCGKEIKFSAQRQKQWYEVKKLNINIKPARCAEHFLKWKGDRNSKFSMDRKLNKLKQDPDSKDAMLNYALSIVEFHRHTGNGNLHTALHLLRQLREEGDAMSYCSEHIQKALQAKTDKQHGIDSFIQETISAFQKAVGSTQKLEAAVITYLIRGYETGIDANKLWKLLETDDKCIITQAQLPEDDELVIWEYLSLLMNAIREDLSKGVSLPDAIEHFKLQINSVIAKSTNIVC